MKKGMLWFDQDTQRSLELKLERASAHYLRKFGRLPDTCHAHPSTLLGSASQLAGMTLRESNHMLPHHFWLGNEDQRQAYSQRHAA